MESYSVYLLITGIVLAGFVYVGDVLAQSEITISASTDKNSYQNGDKIIVNGIIKNFDSETQSDIALTYRTTDPGGSIVSLGQVLPNSKGNFNFTSLYKIIVRFFTFSSFL